MCVCGVCVYIHIYIYLYLYTARASFGLRDFGCGWVILITPNVRLYHSGLCVELNVRCLCLWSLIMQVLLFSIVLTSIQVVVCLLLLYLFKYVYV